MPQIAPPTQPTVSVQVPVPTPVEPAPQSQPAAARPNQDFLDGYAAALQQQGKGKGKDEEPPADPDAKPAAVSLPPQQPDTDRRPQVVPHTLIFPYLPPPRKRFRPRAKYARVSEFTRHPEYHALLSQITPWDKQNDAGDVGHGVLADWLEDRGFPAVARHIRESAALAPEMPGDISPRYGLPGRTQVQPGQPVMDTLHSPSTGKARIVLRLPDKYTPAGDATRMIGVDRRWVSHYMTPAEAAKRVREMGREGVALFRHSTGPGAFGPGGVRHINTDAKAAKRMARPDSPRRYSHEGFQKAITDAYDYRAANRAKDESAGHDPLTPLVYADYLDEQDHPLGWLIRRAMDPERRQAGKAVGMRGMFVSSSAAPDFEGGVSFSSGVGNRVRQHPRFPIWLSGDFTARRIPSFEAPGGSYRTLTRFIAPVTPGEAREFAGLMERHHPGHPTAADIRKLADRYDPPAKRMARPKKFARYRDIAAHPDNAAFHQAIRQAENSEHDDPLPHLVYADWLEDHGHTGMAQIIRSAANAGPTYTQRANPVDGLAESTRGPLEAGQPTVHVYGAFHRSEQRQRQLRGDVRPGDARVFLHLRVPDPGDPGFYRTWQTPPMERPHVAGLLRQLKAEGVAHTIARLGASGPVAPAYRSAANLDTRRRPTWKVDAAGDGYTTRPPEPPTRFRKRKYAAQRAWATWQSLHPEIRHTPLGAALVHVANGHGGDETATHLAYAAVHAAGEHDSPMKLEPIGVLADYLEDNNPGHPLARAFNLNGITNKLELDRLVEAHAAQMAAGEMGVSPGHDWTRNKLSEIRAGHPLHTRQGPPNDLQRAVAAVHAAGFRASDDDVYRSASRVAQRRYKNTAFSQALWSPDDYHAAIGRQVMDGHDVVEANDPNRFARAVAASIGAKK